MFKWNPIFEKLHSNDELDSLETCLIENKTFCSKDSKIKFIYKKDSNKTSHSTTNEPKNEENIFIFEFNGLTFFSLSQANALIALENFRIQEIQRPKITKIFSRLFMNEMEMGVEELGFHQGLFRKFRQIKEAISKGGARLEINQGVFMQFNDSVKFEKYFSDTYGPAVLEKCQNYEQQEIDFYESGKNEPWPFKKPKYDKK